MPAERKKILIIGSAPSEEEIFHNALNLFDLSFTLDCSEALSILQKGEYHLVFLYHKLPSGSGMDLLKTINRKTRKSLPIILIVEQGNEKAAVAASREGISDYLMSDELIPAIVASSVTRSLERKKWENIFNNMTADDNNGSYLKDPVTGTYNKSYLETRLKEEMLRSERYHFPVTLAVLNIDPFEEICQKYGNPDCNGLLKELGQILQRNLRSSDLVSRIQDDLFVILLPHTNREEAKTVWDRINNQVSGYPFTIKTNNIYVHLCGVLIPLNKQIEQMDELIREAEKTLQQNRSTSSTLPLYLEKY